MSGRQLPAAIPPSRSRSARTGSLRHSVSCSRAPSQCGSAELVTPRQGTEPSPATDNRRCCCGQSRACGGREEVRPCRPLGLPSGQRGQAPSNPRCLIEDKKPIAIDGSRPLPSFRVGRAASSRPSSTYHIARYRTQPSSRHRLAITRLNKGKNAKFRHWRARQSHRSYRAASFACLPPPAAPPKPRCARGV